MNIVSLLIGTAAAGALAGAASASVVYDNAPDPTDFGDCSWSTTCASGAGRGDDFAAQEFTLGSSADVTSGGFYESAGSSDTVGSVNWQILDADGAGGLPGTVVASGSGAVTGYLADGADNEGLFQIGSVDLAAGTYYLAIQGVSTNFDEYLVAGAAGSGAANTNDGGTTWTSGYVCEPGGGCVTSVAVELFSGSAVPEPATWTMLLAGFGALGGALRRRARVASA